MGQSGSLRWRNASDRSRTRTTTSTRTRIQTSEFGLKAVKKSGATHGLARVNDLRRNFARRPTPSFTEEVRNQNSGVRSCRICEQGLYPKIRDRHLPGKISAGIPDFLAPELLQLLNSSLARLLKPAGRGGLPGNRGHDRDVWTGSPVVQAGTFRYEPGRRHNPRLTLPLYRTPDRPR